MEADRRRAGIAVAATGLGGAKVVSLPEGLSSGSSHHGFLLERSKPLVPVLIYNRRFSSED